jgi:hypothetical protein
MKGEGVSEVDAASYRLQAANCLEMAEHSDNADRKLFLLRIAQGWVNLADQIERQDGAAAPYPGPGSEQP